MSVFIVFGLPGAGKSFVGKVFNESFNFHIHEGDDELTKEMKKNISSQSVVTDKMRDEYFGKLLDRIKSLQKNFNNFVITQTFIKEKYRIWVLNELPISQFLLVNTNTTIRESRLQQRKEHPLDLAYVRQMCRNFDTPKINYRIINNNKDGTLDLKRQLRLLFDK